MGMRAEAPLGIALRGSSALQMWRSLALLEARALDERQRRWERGDFTHDALPELRASAVLARGRQNLPADYSLRASSGGAVSLAGRFSLDLPLQVQVSAAAQRRSTDTLKARLLALPPTPQFLMLEPGVFIASPELALVDVAAELDETELLLAACELCAIYSPDSNTGRLLERPQIAHRTALEELVGQMGGSKGVRQARFAASAVLERSRSPRETQLGLILSLPSSRGGYGLDRPLLNQPLELCSAASQVYGRGICECDLLFEGASIAVFYDGEETHLNRRQQHNDALRHNALAVQGITELVITNSQIKSIEKMDRIAGIIGSALGKKPCSRKDFKARQLRLHRALLSPVSGAR